MNILHKLLFIYCLLFALFLFISGFVSSHHASQLVMQLTILPLVGYFIIEGISLIKKSDHEHHTPHSKRTRLFLVIISLIILLSLVAYSFFRIISQTSADRTVNLHNDKTTIEK